MPNVTIGDLERLGSYQSGGGGGSGTPGGTDGQIQYNKAGSFGGVTSVPIANGGTGATSGSQGVSGEVTDAPILRKFRAAINTMVNNTGAALQYFVACNGDSLELGVGGGATGLTCPSAYLATATSQMGIFSTNTGFFGCGNAGNRRITYDNRIVLGAGWGYNDAIASLGGGLFTNSTTTNAMSFTPGFVGDKLKVFYRITTGGGLFTIDVDSVGTSSNIDCNGADAIGTFTYTGTGTTYNIKRVSGGATEILGMVHYNSATNQIVYVNCGLSGGFVSDWNVAGVWSPVNVLTTLAPKLNIVSFGTNDWSFNVGTSVYGAGLQTLYTSLSALGDVVFVSPVPANPSDPFAYNVPTATQLTYVATMKTVANTNSCLFVNQFERWTNYASGNALGYYFSDFFHCSASGYRDVGSTRAQAIFGQILLGIPKLTRSGFDAITTNGYQVGGTTVLSMRAGVSIFSNGTTGANSTGSWNTAFGMGAVNNVSTGFNNTGLGYNALNAAGFKQGNTCVGSNAGLLVAGGNYNTIVGAGAGSTVLTSGSSNILIAHGSQTVTTPAAGTNNFLSIGNGIRGYTTAPTIASGFGTSPTITAGVSTFAFTINVGTGGTASSGVITLPAAPTGWIVWANDLATTGATATKQTAGTTTSATLTNYTLATGATAAWPASTVLQCTALAY